MDDVTQSVRNLYEAYPYPSGAPELRTGSDVRFVLSKSALAGPPGRRLHALDAGCGRAIGLIGAASIQPDVQFLGIDINRTALADADRAIRARGLENVSLAEVDLMTLDGLEVPDGGFDVIFSSGVVHHLVDPAAGLQRLTEVLAPHGVLVFMVYGRLGRQPIDQVTHFIDGLIDRAQPVAERLRVAREAVTAMSLAGAGEPWQAAHRLDDIEFVDRYLHIQQTAYSVPELFDLLETANLRFAQWCSPRDWSPRAQLPAAIAQAVQGWDDRRVSSVVEQVTRPRVMELYAVRSDNTPTALPRMDELVDRVYALSPEGTFKVARRGLMTGSRVDAIAFHRADGAELDLSRGPLALAAMLIHDQAGPFDGRTFINALASDGVEPRDGVAVLHEFLRQGIVYCPHRGDIP